MARSTCKMGFNSGQLQAYVDSEVWEATAMEGRERERGRGSLQAQPSEGQLQLAPAQSAPLRCQSAPPPAAPPAAVQLGSSEGTQPRAGLAGSFDGAVNPHLFQSSQEGSANSLDPLTWHFGWRPSSHCDWWPCGYPCIPPLSSKSVDRSLPPLTMRHAYSGLEDGYNTKMESFSSMRVCAPVGRRRRGK